MPELHRQLGELLVDRRVVSRDDLEEHLHNAATTDKPACQGSG